MDLIYSFIFLYKRDNMVFIDASLRFISSKGYGFWLYPLTYKSLEFIILYDWVVSYYIKIPHLFIHSSVDGDLVTDCAVMNMGANILLWYDVFNSSGKILRRGIAELNGTSNPSFFEESAYHFSHWLYSLHSHWQWRRVLFPLQPTSICYWLVSSC